MQFLLTEMVARVVAIYLAYDTGRELWAGYIERKIAPYSPDFLDWFNPWSNRIAYRDVSPVTYWAIVSVHIGLFLCCLVVAIFGWWLPDT